MGREERNELRSQKCQEGNEQRVRIIMAIMAWDFDWEGGREEGRKRVKFLITEMTGA